MPDRPADSTERETCPVCHGMGCEPEPEFTPGRVHVIWDYPSCPACGGTGVKQPDRPRTVSR